MTGTINKKHNHLILLSTFFVLSLAFAACKKNSPEILTPKITNDKVEVTATSATFSWTVDWLGKRISVVEVSAHEDMSDSQFYGSEEELNKSDYAATADNLLPNTKYYYRFWVWNQNYVNNKFVMATKHFRTSTDLPVVKTLEVIDITRTSATGQGKILSDGGLEITERGICWSSSHNPTTSDSHAASSQSTTTFSVSMTNLTPEETYYVRAYAKNAKGTAYSENEMWFVTGEAVPPTVTTAQVTDISWRTAIVGGEVTDDGDATVTERGICWSTSENPTIEDSHIESGSGIGSFTANITGLTAGTTYHVHAYAKNRAGYGYGDDVSFETTDAVAPTVTTANPTDITRTAAVCGGEVTSDGGDDITERGVCWSTDSNPSISGSHLAAAQNGTGSFTVQITGLMANTSYYVCTYATNSVGTSYGMPKSFVTLPISKPSVTTTQVSNITTTTAVGGGNVTDDGGSNVIERGICWSTNQNPTINGFHASSSMGTGAFTVNMTGLTACTTYYVRAYAKNSEGTAYGSEMSFSTNGTFNGHEYVDLGLPSGRLWAACNVGGDNPEDFGDYYAWGETSTKTTYTWGTYQYCMGTYNTLTKYCNYAGDGYNGYTDNLTTLEPDDDAATANWGSGWRMPTKAEWEELMQNTAHVWTTQNGVNGRLFTASNGNSLFLPAAGEPVDGGFGGVGSSGYYWSSSLYTYYSCEAWYLSFSSVVCKVFGSGTRFEGLSVRPVREN